LIISFPDPLLVENVSDRTDKLHEDFIVMVNDSTMLAPICTITVPKGFVTDYASVPHIPFVYEILGGIGKKPAVAHDYLYGSVCAPTLRALGRAWADRVLYAGLIAQRVETWKAWMIWIGVRAGGSFSFQPLAFKSPAIDQALPGSAAAGAPVPAGVDVKT
jgi:hypothetical protein